MIFFLFGLILLISGLLCFIHPTVEDISNLQKQLLKRPQSLKNMVQKKEHRIEKYLQSLRRMLWATNKQSTLLPYLVAAIVFSVIGIFVGLLFENDFLSPVFALLGFVAPFLKIKFDFIHYKQFVVKELESTLSAITISFERTENLKLAISENLPYIHPPLNEFFSQFLFRLDHIDPDEQAAIDELKSSIEHSLFHEWCDAAKRCVSNRNLIYTLQPIVDKFSEINIVVGDVKNTLYRVLREYWSLVILSCILTVISIFGIPIILNIEIPDMVSKMIIAVNAFILTLTSIKVLLEVSDIETDL